MTVIEDVTMSKAKFAAALILLSTAFTFSLPAHAAADAYTLGVKQFSAKTYPLAAANFKKAIAANPRNDSARYYYALSLHYNKDIAGAKKAYAELIRMAPDSNGAGYARAALLSLDPALLSTLPASTRVLQQQVSQMSASSAISSGTQMQSGQSGGRSSSSDTMPDECRVYYTLEQNCFVIDAYVNGRPMKMIFDTGAAICAFGKNNFAAAGIDVPTGKPTGEVHGIGDGGAQSSWDTTVDLKVGTIERKRFPVKVQTQLGEYPLLGQTFFQDFTYTIDNGAHSIHFVKKRSRSGSIYADPSRDPNAVPFTRERNELAINIEVNGRPTKMYFDTGASVVTLTHEQCRSLGITIPEDAQVATVQGIAGSSRARVFNVTSIKVGGITKRDFPVWVPDSEMAGVGLLGQTFYNDCQYTIDYERGYIHFMRR
jgi:clan AA aspartic protease (TIGR02281 family)